MRRNLLGFILVIVAVFALVGLASCGVHATDRVGIITDQQQYQNAVVGALRGIQDETAVLLGRTNKIDYKIDKGFASVNQRLDQVDTRLDKLENRCGCSARRLVRKSSPKPRPTTKPRPEVQPSYPATSAPVAPVSGRLDVYVHFANRLQVQPVRPAPSRETEEPVQTSPEKPKEHRGVFGWLFGHHRDCGCRS